MTTAQDVRDSFVLVQIGDRRFAVPASFVTEMSPPVRLHKFPHTSTRISGVIIRRRKIVPVCNASTLLGGRRSFANVFYLITECHAERPGELMAIPVNGESELMFGEMQPPEENAPDYFSGLLPAGTDSVPVLDLSALAASLADPHSAPSEAKS